MRRPIRRLRERNVYQNNFATVYDDDVGFPDGTEGRYLRVQPAGDGAGVVIIAVHSGTVALVRTYRYPLDEWQWALPRGFPHGPDALSTAEAELLEELGVTGAALRVLGYVTPDSGLLCNRVAVVLAETADRPTEGTDCLEVAEVHWVRLADLDAEVAAGRLEDGFTLAAICLARALGVLQP